jgi:site-specific DNA-cytosine methylase
VIKYVEYFSGLGGGALAVQRQFPKAKSVGFSEVYKPSIETYWNHFPTHNHLGDILKINPKEIPTHDLVIAGPICKNFTRLSGNKRTNFDGKYAPLFFKLVDILKANRHKYFIIENVESMDDDVRDRISEYLGVEPIMINSALVSAQNRKRYYWCNFPTRQPHDRGIFLDSVIDVDAKLKYPCAWSRSTRREVKDGEVVDRWIDERIRVDGKSNTLVSGVGCTAFSSKNIVLARKPKTDFITNKYRDPKDSLLERLKWRYFSVSECERLQTYPLGWTEGMTDNQAYKALGDAFTVDAIEHLVFCLKEHFHGG